MTRHFRLKCLQILLFTGFILSSWAGQVMAVDSIRILAVHSYSQEFPWTKGQHKGFVEALKQDPSTSFIIKTEYLDTKRVPYDDKYIGYFSEHLKIKYQGFKPDAIYVTDDNALNMGINTLNQLFPNTPLFFSGVNNYQVLTQLDHSWQTGVFQKMEITPNLDLLATLFGNVQHVIVVGDNSTTYQAIKHELQKELIHRKDLHVTYISDNNINTIVERLQDEQSPYVLLTTLGTINDGKGNIVTPFETVKHIVSRSSKVIVSLEDAYLFEGVLGGYVTSSLAQGHAAASLLLEYFNGKTMINLPAITHSPNEYILNNNTLEQLDLNVPKDIANSVILLNPRENWLNSFDTVTVFTVIFLVIALLSTLLLYSLIITRKNQTLKQQSLLLEKQGDELQQSEERYRLLFELSEDPMLLIHENMFILANKASANILGYDSVEELRQVHPSRLSPEQQPDGRLSFEKANDMMQKAHQNGYYRFEWQHIKKNGTPLQIEVSLTRIPFEKNHALFCIWHDNTEWRKAEQALREKSTYLDSVLRASVNVGLIAIDTSQHITYYNEAATNILNMSAAELQGQSLDKIHIHEGDISRERLETALRLAEKNGEYRFSIHRKINESPQYIDARLSPIRDDKNTLSGYMLMAEDVTKQHEAEKLIKYQADYDHLTSLPNRRTFIDRLKLTISRCQRHNHKGAVLFIDLDNFKQINDTLGHPIGDTLLKKVADRMSSTIRGEDTVARLGGDEFVILLSEIGDTLETAISDSTHIADKLLKESARPYVIEGREIRNSISIGISIFPLAEESADDILRQADTAMYQAKEAGRNNFKFFSLDMQLKVEASMAMMEKLHHAVEHQQFHVYFQPQVDANGRLLGVESLIRWKTETEEIIFPDEFISLAEESGLIESISDIVLQQTLETQMKWAKDYPEKKISRIAVNVSAIQFQKDNFVKNIKNSVAKIGNDPSILTLELTESMLLSNIDKTIEKMQELKEFGVRFSIDDFGTGYSSLAYLKQLPLSELKIDRSFVRDITTDPNDAALVRTIVNLAHQLNLEVIAEGVESEEIKNLLVEYGCRVFQGYHFSKPVAATDFAVKYLAS